MTEGDDRFRLGFLALARTTFDMALAREMIHRSSKHLKAAGMVLLGPDDAITGAEAADEAARALAAENLDAVVVLQATFTDSRMVRALAEATDAPLLLWAVPERPSGGRLRLNSFCGVNLAAHSLRRSGRRYEAMYAGPEDTSSLERVREIARAGRIKRQLNKVRIGRLGANPDGFDSCMVDAAALKQRLGVEVIPLQLAEFFSEVKRIDANEISGLKDELRSGVSGLDDLDPAPTGKTLGSYLALRRLSERLGLDGFAVRCWPEFFTEMGCAACGALSLLGDRMIPAGCESDVNGVLSQWMLQAIAGTPAFDTDMVAVDDAGSAVVLWHCGKAPLSLADPRENPRATVHSNRQLPLLWEFPLKPGPVTLARLSAATGEYRLVIARGEMIRAKISFSGTSGRCRFPCPPREFLERVLAEGLEHHMALVYGDHLSTLKVLARQLELPVLKL